MVAAAVAAALASSSALEIVSEDGAIRHRHGRAIALSRGRKARHPTQSSQIVGAASRVRCCCSRWLTGVLRSRSCCRCRRRCSGGGSDGGGCGTSKMRHPLVEQLAQSQLPAAPRISALSVTAGRADVSLCATVDSYETRWTESFWVCLESIPDLGCVAARVV